MSTYRVITEYKDGTKYILETSDGGRAMQEAARGSYQEDQPKAVSLEKDGTVLWTEKVKPYKAEAAPAV